MQTTLKLLTRLYLTVVASVFCLTAISKLFSDFSDPRLMAPDPFLSWISAGRLMLCVALFEIVVVAALVRALVLNPAQGVGISIWICSLFLLYRVGFAFAPENAQACKCFGVGSLFGKMERYSDLASLIVLFALMGGALGIRFLQKRMRFAASLSTRTQVATLMLFALATHPTEGASPTGAFTAKYIAEGLVTEHMLNHSGKIILTNSFPFRVVAGADGRWQINWVYHLPRWAMTCSEHISFDGTNVFSVIYSDKRLGKDMEPINNTPLEANEHPGRVCRGPFPVDHSSCVGLLWVAFISGQNSDYSDSKAVPNLLLPNARTSPEAWNTTFNFERLNSVSNGPISSAAFSLNKESIKSNLLDYPEVAEPTTPAGIDAVNQDIKRMQRATSDELLRSEYKLDGFDEREGSIIPTRFSGVRYSMIDSLEGHFPFIKWEATVTNIVFPAGNFDLLPIVYGKVNVQDRRFMNRSKSHYVDSVFYLLDDKGWALSTNDARFQGDFELPVLRRQTPTLRKIVFYASALLFAALLGLPLLAYKKGRGRSRGN